MLMKSLNSTMMYLEHWWIDDSLHDGELYCVAK